MEDRRDLDPAPPAHRPAAAAAAPPQTELGGPGTSRDPAQRDTESTPPRAAAAGHPGHDPAVARQHRPPPLGRQVHAQQHRPPGHPPEHQDASPPASPGEPRMGLPQDPRRTGRPGSKDSGVDGTGDPEERRNRPRAATDRASLVPVPAPTSRSGPGVRFLYSQLTRRHPGLRPGGDRTRDPAHPHPWSHAASDRGMDHPAGTQPPHGPRRATAPGTSPQPSTRSSPMPGSGPCSATSGRLA